MQTLRRLYIYAVAFVSLEVVLWGAIGLARSFVVPRSVGGENQLAEAVSLILVGIPVFLLHWWWFAQRTALRLPGERSALLRAIFLYGVLLATLIPVVNNALSLIDRLMAGLFGLDVNLAPLGGMQTLSDNLIAIVFNAIAAGYFYFVLRQDWKVGPLGDDYAEIRRLFRYIWMVYGLVIAGIGFQRTLEAVILWIGPRPPGYLYIFTSGLALLVIGAPLWGFSWWTVRRSLDDPAEIHSRLRLFVLYALVFVAAFGTLISAGNTIYQVIGYLLGLPVPDESLWVSLSLPFSALVPFVLGWLLYGRELLAYIASLSDAPPRQAELRRLYRYVLAFFGLWGAVFGLQQLLLVLLDMVLGSSVRDAMMLNEQLSTGIAALVVGLPLWIWSWRLLILEVGTLGESGDRARRSLVRRGYLYLVLFLAVIGVMFTGGLLLYTVISTLLGEPPEDMPFQAAQHVLTLLLFAALLFYHAWVLRQDANVLERALVRKLAQYPVLVLSPDEPEFVEALIAAIEREAPGMPVAVQPISQGAPDETLSAAKAVVLPGSLLSRTPEAMRLWLQAYTGQRIVLPTPTDELLWVTVNNHSLSTQARRTARLLRRLAGGE